MFKKLKAKLSKKTIAFLVAFSLVFPFIPIPAKAGAGNDWESYLVYQLLGQVFEWLKGEMLSKLKDIAEKQTQAINDNANKNFGEQRNWQWQNGALNGRDIQANMDKYYLNSKKASSQNTTDFNGLTQGDLSGVDAKKDPVESIRSFNDNYKRVQDDNPDCKIDLPPLIGDKSKNCTTKQMRYTNYILSGISPLVKYPDAVLNNPIGQQYEIEKKVSIFRRNLAETSIEQTTNPVMNDFLEYMEKQIALPTPEQINSESEAAVARDTLVMLQTIAKIQLMNYQATLANQRLLATIVSQHEDEHYNKRILELGKAMHR